jgi:NADPH2:quinone reductase
VPAPGEVLVSVRAAGVNFPDLLIIENKYQVKPPLPFSPGCEAAGVVKVLGEGVANLRVGQRVMAVTGYGAFAEEVCVPSDRVFPAPDGMDDATAAAFLFTYGTACHALVDRAHLRAGETLLVLGAAGGVGLASVEVGKALGARVIACASSAEKLAVCREHGADETIDYSTGRLREDISRIVGDAGVNVVCDPVGGPYSETAIRAMAWAGRFLVVGFTAGEIPKIALNLPLLKGCSIVGVFWGSMLRREPALMTAGLARLTEWYEQGRLRPRIHRTLPLARAAEAMRLLSSREVMGKVVVAVSD